MIGPAGFVLSGNLPDGKSTSTLTFRQLETVVHPDVVFIPVLLSYEVNHDLMIVDPSEYDGLRTLCAQHSDLELGPKELFNFLR